MKGKERMELVLDSLKENVHQFSERNHTVMSENGHFVQVEIIPNDDCIFQATDILGALGFVSGLGVYITAKQYGEEWKPIIRMYMLK